jgi:hypothetical protein
MANVEAWTVGVHLDESYVEELFRARYLEMVRLATLGTAAPLGPPQIAQPRGGGITVFRYSAGLETQAGAGSTVAAWPGSGVRPGAISLSTHLDYMGRSFTVTAYDAAGHVVATDTLGTIG